MESAETSFISSTFWTERIGPSAALKTLEVMEKLKSWDILTKTGSLIQDRWINLDKNYDIEISCFGLPSLAGFSFVGENSLEYKTLLTQEMLKKGYLAGTSIYSCIEHNEDILDEYFKNLDPIFQMIKSCQDGNDVHALLDGPVCHSGFKRLN